MSLADQASLLLIPSGYKESKIYSVFPTTGVGDFTFNRNSSATRIAKNGLITSVATDIPRLEYPLIDGVVNGCPSFLLENSATNLITYSEDFSNSSWVKNGASITSNVAISPDGSLSADKLVEGTTTGEKFTQTIKSVSNTTIYTASVFVKFAGREWIRLTDAQSSNRIHFNTKTGVFGSATGTVISYESTLLGDGWYKLSLTTTSVATAYAMRIVLAENDNDVSYTGDGTSGVYIYGAQLEESSYPTSYIESNIGTTTTRAAETANGAGDATTFNDSEGVLMFEVSTLTSGGGNRIISLTDGTSANKLEFNFDPISNRFTLVFTANSINQYIVQLALNEINFNKIAVKYKANDFSLWINGIELNSQLSGNTSLSNSFDTVNLANQSGSFNFYGKTKQIQYYNSALTDIQLEEISSWTSFTDLANGQQYSIK